MFCVGVAKTELMQMEFINCFYVTVTKTPDKSSLRKERFILSHNFRMIQFTGGEREGTLVQGSKQQSDRKYPEIKHLKEVPQ